MSVPTITGVATSITAFVGRARRGPTNEPVPVTSFGDFERHFGGLWTGSRLGFAVRDFFANGGNQAVIVRLYRPAAAGRARAALDVGDLQLEAAAEGEWGNSLRARIDHATRDHDPGLDAPDSLFNLFVRDGTTGVIEEHRNVVCTPPTHPRLVGRVLANESHLVRVTALGARPAPSSNAVDPGGTVWDDNTTATSSSVVAAGRASDGEGLTSAEFTASGLEARKEGLYALERIDLFNLLVLPPYRSDDTVDTRVVTDAAHYCERRRAMLLVDPLPTWTTADDAITAASGPGGLAGALGTASHNAALYFPRLRQPNPLLDDQLESFAPAGAVAGVLARTDASRGVWKAPAGVEATVTGVPELSVPPTDNETSMLNPLAVNCLRTIPPGHTVLWGSRTMQGADGVASEWKYLPVRRTALFLEESLYRGTEWVTFEPNDEPLWAQIRLVVGEFLNDLFRHGAFQGITPGEAFLVKCDSGTTTPADIDSGLVNILVGFAPLKPAEFVMIRLQQTAGQPHG